MTTPERDLVEAMRAELAAIDPPRRCCRRAEAAGLEGALRPRRRATARLALRLRRWKETGPVDALPPAFDWTAAPDHCRAAYLRGRFLAHGSVSLASGRTHLEFVVAADDARALCEHLSELGLYASWRLRRGRGVVTWKSTETLGTFLRLVGGGAALLELEARQVSRTVRGDLNRVINAESANLQRAVEAAARQLEAIDTLEADGRLRAQPYVVRVVAQGRRDIPEATFTELAERLELHRSAVQRALARIERLALHPSDEVEERPGRARGRREGVRGGRDDARRAD
jgi:DNA-binding transcriptional regulator WhiA